MTGGRSNGDTFDAALWWTEVSLILGGAVALYALGPRSFVFLGLTLATVVTTIWRWRRRRRARSG